MLKTQKINGTGELLPRLQNILVSRGIMVIRVMAGGAHVGWCSQGSIFVAKKELFRGQVSTQLEVIEKCQRLGRWLCFWIPGVGILKFNPKVLLEKGWRNMRSDEMMVNIDARYGMYLSSDDLNMAPLSEPVQQLSLAY